MESLRWILLALGIIFIVAIYLIDRKRRNFSTTLDDDLVDDVPNISALTETSEFDDVHIVAQKTDRYSNAYIDEPYQTEPVVPEDDEDQSDGDQSDGDRRQARESGSDIMVLYVMAQASESFTGEQIMSVALSNGLSFGDMNIFHRLDDADNPVFGLANMLEPGSFDPDQMTSMTTPGLTMFTQLSRLDDPVSSFDDMLQCAYQISDALGASLCNHRRQPLTEQGAETYRQMVKAAPTNH